MSIRLSCICRFINTDHVPKDHPSVCGDFVSTLQFHKISDYYVALGNGHNPWLGSLSRATYHLYMLLVTNLFPYVKLSICFNFENKGYPSRKKNSKQDTDRFKKESCFVSLKYFVGSYETRQNEDNAKDKDKRILELLKIKGEKRPSFWLWNTILPDTIPHFRRVG